MKQKKNYDMRNWFLGTVIVGGIVLGLAKNVNNNTQKPGLERKVERVEGVGEVEKVREAEYVVEEKNIEKIKTKPRLKYEIKQGDYFEKIEFNKDLVHGSLTIMNPNIKPEKLQIGQEIIIGYVGKPDFAKQRNLFPNDPDMVFLARMLFGEARGCSEFEKAQIGYSVINKINDNVNWNGTTLRQVLNCETFNKKSKKRRSIYDCFNQKDNNWLKVNNPEKYDKKAWEECLKVAEGVLSKKYEDKTKKATIYFNPKIANPYWRDHKNTTLISIERCKHKFYRER